MAHYAELDLNNTVLRVIVIPNEAEPTEAAGIAYCENLLGGRWIKTSYNGNIRGKYAGIGDTYDQVNDIFVSPPQDLSGDSDDQ
jgi:hypothetical protein